MEVGIVSRQPGGLRGLLVLPDPDCFLEPLPEAELAALEAVLTATD